MLNYVDCDSPTYFLNESFFLLLLLRLPLFLLLVLLPLFVVVIVHCCDRARVHINCGCDVPMLLLCSLFALQSFALMNHPIDYYLNHRYCEHQIKDAINDMLFCLQLL